MSQLFEIVDSAIAGKGAVAIQRIPKGVVVHTMTGVACTVEDLFTLVGEGKEQPSDPFQIGDNEFLDLEETSRSFNHSCDPNVFVRGKNELVALRDIENGEEITFDYSTTMKYDAEKILAAGFPLWTCVCACGAPNCRGIIDEFKSLTPAIQAHYRNNGWLPDYLMR